MQTPEPPPPPTLTIPDAASYLLSVTREMLLLLDGSTMVIVNANAAAVQVLGYPRDVLIGMPIGDIECALSDLFFWDEMRLRTTAAAASAYRCADGTVLDVTKQVTRVNDLPLLFAVSATATAQEHKVASDLNIMGSRLRATLEATFDGQAVQTAIPVVLPFGTADRYTFKTAIG